jgi:hypothetical protein
MTIEYVNRKGDKYYLQAGRRPASRVITSEESFVVRRSNAFRKAMKSMRAPRQARSSCERYGRRKSAIVSASKSSVAYANSQVWSASSWTRSLTA